jgi:hypothetical protein
MRDPPFKKSEEDVSRVAPSLRLDQIQAQDGRYVVLVLGDAPYRLSGYALHLEPGGKEGVTQRFQIGGQEVPAH